MIDEILDSFQLILPNSVSYLKSVYEEINDENSDLKKKIDNIIIVLKFIFVIHTIYVLYRIKFIENGKYYKINIYVKGITSIISLIFLISPLINAYGKNF